MSGSDHHLYAALEPIFHEPNRLAIMSALAGATEEGLAFTDLKSQCKLTDGNLSRHLKALEEAKAVRVEKSVVGTRPRTTVHLSDAGREAFMVYLQALESVLRKAASALAPEGKREEAPGMAGLKPSRA